MAKSWSGKDARLILPAPGITGFILAGGRSRRMGQDKAHLQWRGQTLLDYITAVVSTACETVRVVGRGPLVDQRPGNGPLGGIATALAVTTTPKNLIVAVDLPLLTPPFARWLAVRTLSSAKPMIVCRVGSRYPICLGIDRSLEPDARRRIESNTLTLREFIDASNPEIVPEEEIEAAGFSRSMFLNVNTPADWEAISRMPIGPA